MRQGRRARAGTTAFVAPQRISSSVATETATASAVKESTNARSCGARMKTDPISDRKNGRVLTFAV